MQMPIHYTLMFLILSLILYQWPPFLHAAPLKADPPIQVVTSEYAPFSYLENGRPKGFCTEIVQTLLKELGIRADIATLPWARAYNTALKKRNILIYTLARTPGRESLFQWVGVLVRGKSYLFSLKSRPIRLDSLDQAKAYHIGSGREDVRAAYLKNQGFKNLDLVIHAQMNARKLINGRIDLWAEGELAAVHTVRQLGYDPDKVLSKAFLLEMDTPLVGYLAFGIDTDPDLVRRFSKALEKLKQNKTYEHIKHKYIQAPDP